MEGEAGSKYPELSWLVKQLVLAWGQYRRDLEAENKQRRAETDARNEKDKKEYRETLQKANESIEKDYIAHLEAYAKLSDAEKKKSSTPRRESLFYLGIRPPLPQYPAVLAPSWHGFMDWLAEHHAMWEN